MTASRVILRHHVEQERFDCEIQRLVLEEEFGHETEALAVHLVFLAVHLKHGGLTVTIDLSAGRMTPRTEGLVEQASSVN